MKDRPAAHRERNRRWERSHREYFRNWRRERGIQAKLEVLSHYGPEGSLRCSWSGCTVDDVDVLTLDHVNDDGNKERRASKRSAGIIFYVHLRAQGYPTGFQTLCCNHQMKKEILRRRANSKNYACRPH